MKLLNVGCGGQRPQDECWWNLDTLREFLKPGTPERTNLDAEPRYVECDVLKRSIPFDDDFFDGVLLQHVLEHMTCHEAVDALISCRRVLKTGGILVASVPNVSYFRLHHDDDNRENAVRIFGEPISEKEHDTFFSYALFHREHKQILNVDGLWALLRRAGLGDQDISSNWWTNVPSELRRQLNRPRFSIALWAVNNR